MHSWKLEKTEMSFRGGGWVATITDHESYGDFGKHSKETETKEKGGVSAWGSEVSPFTPLLKSGCGRPPNPADKGEEASLSLRIGREGPATS